MIRITIANGVSIMEFGEFLRMKRTAKNMTIRQVALYAGCSDSYLSMLERGVVGQRGPSPAFLRKLVTPLGVPYEVLMAVAGYRMQHEDESLFPGSLILMLRDALCDTTEEFAKRAGLSPYEIETLEQQGVSFDTLYDISQRLFSRQRTLSPQQKDLFHRIEEAFSQIPATKSTTFTLLMHSLLDFVNDLDHP